MPSSRRFAYVALWHSCFPASLGLSSSSFFFLAFPPLFLLMALFLFFVFFFLNKEQLPVSDVSDYNEGITK